MTRPPRIEFPAPLYHVTARQRASELSAWAGGLKMHPDAASPGGNARPKVDVRVQIEPAVEGVPVCLEWRDADDPSDDNGPIDDDPDPPDPSKPDERPANPADNLGTLSTSLSDASPSTDANGQVRVTLDVGAIQPGNNFRVAASLWSSSLSRVLARSADFTSDVFYDENGDGIWQGEEPLLYDTLPIFGCVATPLLTVWRHLHVEVDSMGAVQDNIRSSEARMVLPGGDEILVDLDNAHFLPAEDDNRFQGGTLLDSNSESFEVIRNSWATVIVKKRSDGVIPVIGDIELRDDDAQTMPKMPNDGLLEEALAPASVLPVVDGGGDPSNNKESVSFDANVPDWELVAQIEATGALESHGNRSDSFWIGYIQSGYQGSPADDDDPDSEDSECGNTVTTAPRKGSLVYLETMRDYADARNLSEAQAALLVQRVVVHELAHQFYLEDHQGDPPSIMHYDTLRDLDNPDGSRFNETQLRAIRERAESPGS